MEHVTSRLRYFPVSAFAATMGLAGLALVAQRSVRLWGFPFWIGHVFLAIAVAVFFLFAVLYFAKALRYQDAVVAELKHPLTFPFFPAFSISLFLFAIAVLDIHSEASRTLWVAGVVLQSILILLVVTAWDRHTKLELEHFSPSWFIPIVGNMLVPISGVHHYSPEISWFFFSLGIVFWLVLLTIVFYRTIFHAPLPRRLAPMRCMVIAPPAAAFLGYLSLTGGVDAFARVVYYTTLFMVLIVVLQYRSFLGPRFTMSWWTLSFSIAIATLATMRLFELSHWLFLKGLAGVLYALLVATVGALVALTLRAVARNEIGVAES